MTNRIIIFLMYSLILSCKNSDTNLVKKSSFTSFRIGYTNGWTKETAFFMDSNKILFYPVDTNVILYAKLNDTIADKINNYIAYTIANENLKDNPSCCNDCEVLAFERIVNNDTLQVIQAGRIDSTLMQIFITLDMFRKTNELNELNSQLFIETRLTPPQKPIVRFVKPKLKE